MKTLCSSRSTSFIATIVFTGISVVRLGAHESEHKSMTPGFRPSTEGAAEFVQHAESSQIAVFPSIVRTVKPAEDEVVQEHSSVALDRVVEFLKENKLGTARIADLEFDMGEPSKGGQFAVFNETIQAIGTQLDPYQGDAEYILLFDIIGVNKAAWGIQCYVLDRTGRNVFSFLLNSHHEALVDADIRMQDESAESKKIFIAECIELALNSLKAQVELDRDVAAYEPDPLHVGKYTGKEDPVANYIELKEDGSFDVMDDNHAVQGTYAVVNGNVLVLSISGQGNHPVGRFKDGKLVTLEGEELIKTEPDRED